jgi:glycosyltransferase involved in cell wall biosynthesis
VVPTYNEEKNIEKCLQSLHSQTVPRERVEIIVVDGDSGDRTREIAERLADKVIIQTSEGVGGARNDGFTIATAPIVATTDADCQPYPRWLEAIQSGFDRDDVVAVTGYLDPMDWGEMGGAEKLTYQTLFWLSNVLLTALSALGKYHLCGANSAFRKTTFLETGGYLPLTYADDTELYKRIKHKGRVKLLDKMVIHYSVRRIKKMGLLNYIRLVFKMEWDVSIMNRKPMKGGYARQTYE